MNRTSKRIQEAIAIFKQHRGVMRYQQAIEAGIYDRILYSLRDSGIVTLLERGLYQLQDDVELENPEWIIVAKKIPNARICLLSALAYHELTDEIPHHVHIAVPKGFSTPEIKNIPIKIYRFSPKTFESGVQLHSQNGIEFKVFSPAKTVADCFKFRNQLGLNIAIEALKRVIKDKKASLNEIVTFAKLCRVENVMQPYLEAIVHE